MGILAKIKSGLIAILDDRKSTMDELISAGKLIMGRSANTDNARIDVRPTADKLYVSIGDGALVSGHFVVEHENGYISIGKNSFIGGGMFVSACGIDIGDDVMFSWGCTVIDNDAHSLNWKDRLNDVVEWKKGVDEGSIGKFKNWSNVRCAPIVIESNAWIGFNVIILKGVRIGKGAVVAAGSVVTHDVEAFTMVAGNPAREIKKFE